MATPQKAIENMTAMDKHLQILRDLYTIKGDGLAEVKLNKLKANKEFKAMINGLAKLDIKAKNKI